jgi:drug/metabolite transporter (DMT)-like permease
MPNAISYATNGRHPLPRIDLQKAVWPIVAILSAVGLWGGSFATMRYALRTLDPWSVMWLRMAIALAALMPFAGRLRRSGYQRGDWRLLVPMVLFQPCLYFWLESRALCLTTSSQAGVIAASVPLMVSVGAYLLLSEPMGVRSILGLTLSMAGVAGLTLMQGGQGQAVNPYLGNMLELGAMVCAAANMLAIKKLCARYSSWTLTALQVAAGTIFFLPGLWFLIESPPAHCTVSLVATLVFLGLFVTLGAFGLYNWGMSRMPAGKASIFINLVPVIAVLVGWLAMDETLTPAQCLAALTVMGGVWMSQKSRNRLTGNG